MDKVRLDQIGYWSEVKLDIVREYASAYSTIMAKQKPIRDYLYIDAFAGPGVHISKQTGQYIPGSPLNALNVTPPFREYHFIDMDGGRADALRLLAGDRPDVTVHEGECSAILVKEVFPRARYQDFSRALCLLDPYNVNPQWEVTRTAGSMKSVEVFLNFMVMDMNMNVLRRDPDKVDAQQAARMDAFWGDSSWRNVAYVKTPTLFEPVEEKASNEAIAKAFQERLRKVAGFKYVPDPMPMRNSKGAVIYYLFFASPNETGGKIVTGIFRKYRDRGVG